MCSRTRSLAREDITRSWSKGAQPDWGAALAGNSALREASAMLCSGGPLPGLLSGGLSSSGARSRMADAPRP
eukprot:421167-Pyramimonas_sp.AAC.1